MCTTIVSPSRAYPSTEVTPGPIDAGPGLMVAVDPLCGDAGDSQGIELALQ